MLKVIYISGKAGHGKDTFANALADTLKNKGKRVLIMHYADRLKDICRHYFGWNGEKDEVGRTLLQYIGTDMGRQRLPDVWVKPIKEFISIFGDMFDYILIPDTRFPNEIGLFESYREIGEISVRIIRKDYVSSLTLEQQNHISETSLDDFSFDSFLMIPEGMEHVQDAVNELLFLI